MSSSSKARGKRRADPSRSRSPAIPSLAENPAPVPLTDPEAPPVASSSTIRPHFDFGGRVLPMLGARANVLDVRWSQADIDNMAHVDPVETAFENDRLRRLLAAAYHDLEQERVHNAHNVASYESELAYYRQQRRSEE